jgi:hypothetical protein
MICLVFSRQRHPAKKNTRQIYKICRVSTPGKIEHPAKNLPVTGPTDGAICRYSLPGALFSGTRQTFICLVSLKTPGKLILYFCLFLP